jgi:cytochrome c oxidase subunit III
MNATAILKVGDTNPGGSGAGPAAGSPRHHRGETAGIALWVFMGVATALFSLFITAYVMRMEQPDWYPLAIPWQLWISTALLVAGSVLLQRSSSAARKMHWPGARALLLAGGACALAFLGVQLWAWLALHANHVTPTGNPAGSFFYLLTAMHGLHVAGGLVAWALTARQALRDAGDAAWRIALCARYWHFLLAVWVVLFAALGWLTPELVRYICGTR